MTTLLAVDPGWSTGISYWNFSDSEPATLRDAWQVEGGVSGFLEWARREDIPHDFVVSEKFTPRQSLTLRSAEPLLIEGAMIALDIIGPYGPKSPSWNHPAQMYFTGGRDLADKKKRAHKWLKEHGLYVTGKDVGCKDANDVRSALLHAMVWFRKQKHAPTLKRFFGGNE